MEGVDEDYRVEKDLSRIIFSRFLFHVFPLYIYIVCIVCWTNATISCMHFLLFPNSLDTTIFSSWIINMRIFVPGFFFGVCMHVYVEGVHSSNNNKNETFENNSYESHTNAVTVINPRERETEFKNKALIKYPQEIEENDNIHVRMSRQERLNVWMNKNTYTHSLTHSHNHKCTHIHNIFVITIKLKSVHKCGFYFRFDVHNSIACVGSFFIRRTVICTNKFQQKKKHLFFWNEKNEHIYIGWQIIGNHIFPGDLALSIIQYMHSNVLVEWEKIFSMGLILFELKYLLVAQH